MNFLAARAGLNEEQKQAFGRYRSDVRAKRRELRKANVEVTDAYWVEVMKPQPDPAKQDASATQTLHCARGFMDYGAGGEFTESDHRYGNGKPEAVTDPAPPTLPIISRQSQ
ncbi:MAG TPA: hypothetical protein VJ810_34520 [Blastocatellia bacterium]|nr:hypothetical protein [Blastocatellia bacterium]